MGKQTNQYIRASFPPNYRFCIFHCFQTILSARSIMHCFQPSLHSIQILLILDFSRILKDPCTIKKRLRTTIRHPPSNKSSMIREAAKPRKGEYYDALINTSLYDPRLGSKEAHESRHQARLTVLHSENTSLPIPTL